MSEASGGAVVPPTIRIPSDVLVARTVNYIVTSLEESNLLMSLKHVIQELPAKLSLNLVEIVVRDKTAYSSMLQLLYEIFGRIFKNTQSTKDDVQSLLTQARKLFSVFEPGASAIFVCFKLGIDEDVALLNELTKKFEDEASDIHMTLCKYLNIRVDTEASPEYDKYVAQTLKTTEYLDPYHLVDDFYNWISIASDRNSTEFTRKGYRGFYSPYFALCQRSGTGKTRLLYETGGTKTFMCYVLLDGREYSPTPKKIAEKLQSINYEHSIPSEEQKPIRKKALAFIAATMKYLLDFVRQHCNGHEHDVECFSGFFANFSTVDNQERSDATWNQILSHWEYFENQGFSLVDLYRDLRELKVDKLVIAFDEARELLKPEGSVNAFKIFRDVLSNTWRSMASMLCLVVTDTNSTISNFTPSLKEFSYHSSRVIPPGNDLFPPFYYFNSEDIKALDYLGGVRRFVACQEDNSFGDFFTWRDDNTVVKQFAKLGCPLWSQMLDFEEVPSIELSVSGTLEFALSKLKGSDQATKKSYIAALAARCSIKILPVSFMARELVANHMAMLYYLTEDRTYAFVGYPSDPVLAASSVPLLTEGGGMDCLNALQELATDVVVDVGKAGETVLQLVLQAAADKVFTARTAKPSVDYFKSMMVKDLLSALCPDHFKTIEEGIGANDPIFEGLLFFNHSVELEETLTPEDVRVLLSRGALIVGCHTQPGWDILVPVILANGTLTGLFFQAKNYRTFLADAAVHDWTEKSHKASIVCSEGRTAQLTRLEEDLHHATRKLNKLVDKHAREDFETLPAAVEKLSLSADAKDEIVRLHDRKRTLKAQLENFDYSSPSLHILVNFCQGNETTDRLQFNVDAAERTVVIQGDLIGTVFRDTWATPPNSISRDGPLNWILHSDEEGFIGLSERGQKARRSVFAKSFPVADRYSLKRSDIKTAELLAENVSKRQLTPEGGGGGQSNN